VHMLIPYVRLPDHSDPMFDEWTYGDGGSRGRKLRDQVQKGDFLFFHTTLRGRKYVTAYFVAEQSMDTMDVVRDRALSAKYKNPHIQEFIDGARDYPDSDDVILFGDPLRSRVLDVPLPFDRGLARKLSLGVRFPRGRSDSLAIGSATRTWRELSDKDVNAILREAKRRETEGSKRMVLSSEEVSEFLEKDIERCLHAEPGLVGRGLRVVGRQVDTDVGRIDLLCEDRRGGKTVVEVKLGNIGNDAVNQLRRYMSWVRKGSRKPVSGILVCKGVLPAFEDEFRHLKNIHILCYGWQPVVYRWGSR